MVPYTYFELFSFFLFTKLPSCTTYSKLAYEAKLFHFFHSRKILFLSGSFPGCDCLNNKRDVAPHYTNDHLELWNKNQLAKVRIQLGNVGTLKSRDNARQIASEAQRISSNDRRNIFVCTCQLEYSIRASSNVDYFWILFICYTILTAMYIKY